VRDLEFLVSAPPTLFSQDTIPACPQQLCLEHAPAQQVVASHLILWVEPDDNNLIKQPATVGLIIVLGHSYSKLPQKLLLLVEAEPCLTPVDPLKKQRQCVLEENSCRLRKKNINTCKSNP